MKLMLGLILVLCIPLMGFAQEQMEDVLYLKNGEVMRGTILELVPDGEVKLQTAIGNIYIFEMSEIERISKETAFNGSINQGGYNQPMSKKDWKAAQPVIIKEEGYKFSFDMGVQAGASGAGFTMQMVNGYYFSRHLALSLGIGLDSYPEYTEVYSPFTAHISGDIIKGDVVPTYFAELGYSAPWPNNWGNVIQLDGGFTCGFGAGVEIYTKKRAAVVFGLGWKYQHTSGIYTDWNWDPEAPTFERVRDIQRITFKFGFNI